MWNLYAKSTISYIVYDTSVPLFAYYEGDERKYRRAVRPLSLSWISPTRSRRIVSEQWEYEVTVTETWSNTKCGICT